VRPVADAPADAAITQRGELYRGFRSYQEIQFELRTPGAGTTRARRELLRVGRVAAVLPYDPLRDAVVLFRQFRIGAHEACGAGEIIEIVAGLVDEGESLEEAARRETREETGLEALDLLPLFEFLPSPGVLDEYAGLFCARVDIGALPETAGVEGESETTRPFAIPAEEAAALARAPHALHNGYTLLALMWFALHREEVRARWP